MIAAMTAAFACACTRELVPDTEEYRDVVLSASAGDKETRSSRDATGTFYWSPGDEINLFRGTGGGKFVSTNNVAATSADFVGTLPSALLDDPSAGNYWAVYPYSESNSFDAASNTLTTAVPSAQTAAEGTFADGQFVSIGCSSGLSMTFYHLCGGIKFRVENAGFTSVTLSGRNNETLAGTVEVRRDNDGHPYVHQVVNGSTAVTLTCSDGFVPGVEYFIVTLPVSFSNGFTLTFDGGLTRTVNAAMNVNRAKFQWSNSALDSVFDITYETCDIENAGMRSFLTNVDYSDDPNCTTTLVANYSSTGSDKPLPVTISWTGAASKIVLSKSPLFIETSEVSVTGHSASVYNLIPGVKYYYKVLGNNGSVLKTACVTPVGPIRMVYGVSDKGNVRDLGGWTADGGHIAYGKLFRGSKVDDIQKDPTEKDIFLNTLGVDIDLDLRGLPAGNAGGSGEKNPWKDSDPIQYENVKLWHYFVANGSSSYQPTDAEMGATAEVYQQTIRRIIGWLGEGKVVYFHCHGGSDRTGTLAFLIEALLGVSESDLSKDYELTYFSGSTRKRDGSGGWFFPQMVKYLHTFAPTGTIKDCVTTWAKTRHSNDVDPLTDAEIALLRQYMIEAD